MTRARVPALALLAVACADGRIRLEEDGPFGPVRSAVWLEVDVDRDVVVHRLVATDVPRFCTRAAEAAAGLDAAAAALEAALFDAVTASDVCVARERFYDTAFRATRRIYGRGASFLTLSFDDRSGRPERPPESATYEVVDEDDPIFEGHLLHLEANPFREAMRGDCRDDFDQRLDDLRTTRTVVDGLATLDQRRRDMYRLTLQGTLEDERGRLAGEVDVRGRFELCELDVTAAALPLLWFLPPLVEEPPVDTDPQDTDEDTTGEDAE